MFCKILVNRWFRVDPVFLRRYNKNEYENLEVNAGKWTRIIVEVEPPARWIRKQKQLRFPQPFASFAESCGKAPLQRCIFPQNRAEEGAALCAQNAAFAAFRQARRRVFCFPTCCILRRGESPPRRIVPRGGSPWKWKKRSWKPTRNRTCRCRSCPPIFPPRCVRSWRRI